MNELTKVIKFSVISVGILSSLTILSSCLIANDDDGRMGRNMPSFESFDLDGDGTISENELKKARAKRMEEKKADGKLLRNSMHQAEFKEIDLDGDCSITEEEFKAYQDKKRK